MKTRNYVEVNPLPENARTAIDIALFASNKTAAQLAKACGVHPTTISKLRHAEIVAIDRKLLRDLASELQVPADRLVRAYHASAIRSVLVGETG